MTMTTTPRRVEQVRTVRENAYAFRVNDPTTPAGRATSTGWVIVPVCLLLALAAIGLAYLTRAVVQHWQVALIVTAPAAFLLATRARR